MMGQKKVEIFLATLAKQFLEIAYMLFFTTEYRSKYDERLYFKEGSMKNEEIKKPLPWIRSGSKIHL